MMRFVIIWIIGIIIAGIVASNKNRSVAGWALGSVLFTPLIVLILLLLPPLPSWEKGKDVKKCPYCAEMIKAEAIVCRYCGKELSKIVDIN